MDITKHFLFNLALLFILLFVCLVWSERSRTKPISKPSAIFYFVSSLWVCFAFSYELSDELRLDLRNIPVVIGGLYMGIGPMLAIVTVLIRAMFGVDLGFLTNLLLYGFLFIFLWRIHPWFWKQTPKNRILYAVILTTLISIATLICMSIVRPSYLRWDIGVAYMVIPPLGVGLISYSIEFLMKNLLIRQHLVKAKKLEAVEQMGAAISHEIRNPLTAALGFVQLLQESDLDEKKRDLYLSLVKGELESAERVIQDYLTFSKPSFHTLEELNVSEELAHVLTILQPLTNQNSVLVETNFSLNGLIKADRQKFHQCFLNLIKNAIESMPDGGVLYIETQSTSSQVTIQIKDSGVGMTRAQIERLGEPYYSTKEVKGTGLGMMVVYSIVRAMKGTIRVDSEPEKGTVFQISFPAY
ncbi:sensor histidine kinase [Peribacillus glennii]|uniref:histidine kinase n=1 Tax=Peribacillus glennii TaxID=2303991 RepID=A0A372L7D9_9BACI|nr:HAMP domain-containing sensor histidine kinase [Peribacillus glennii]RFU61153.1 sensor histidine kinase [Peribacillus glennii]